MRTWVRLNEVLGHEVFIPQQPSQLTETGNKLVPDLFNSKRLSMANHGLVFVCEPGRFDLYRKGIEVALPEPFRGAKLHVPGIDGCEFRQVGEKKPSLSTILEAQGEIRDSVGNNSNIVVGERIKAVRCRLVSMDEMTEAALEGETVGQFREARDNRPNGYINALQSEVPDYVLTLDFVPRVVDELSCFCEGLHFGAVGFARLTVRSQRTTLAAGGGPLE